MSARYRYLCKKSRDLHLDVKTQRPIGNLWNHWLFVILSKYRARQHVVKRKSALLLRPHEGINGTFWVQSIPLDFVHLELSIDSFNYEQLTSNKAPHILVQRIWKSPACFSTVSIQYSSYWMTGCIGDIDTRSLPPAPAVMSRGLDGSQRLNSARSASLCISFIILPS